MHQTVVVINALVVFKVCALNYLIFIIVLVMWRTFWLHIVHIYSNVVLRDLSFKIIVIGSLILIKVGT